MTKNKVNVGPAFPIVEHDNLVCAGMTLRDYFAAISLNGMLSSSSESNYFDTDEECFMFYAKRAYGYADAMLEARKQC